MKYTFGYIFIFIAGLMLYGTAQQVSKSDVTQSGNLNRSEKKIARPKSDPAAIALLKDRCVRCHGAVKNGKKRIKGKFDLTPYMQGERLTDHPAWAKVIEQIKNNTMPPEDSKTELSDREGLQIVEMLENSFNSKTLPKRVLTPYEVGFSMSDVFNYDLERFDPFERLRFASNEGKEYSTVHSSDFMTADFINEVKFGVEEISKHYILPALPASKKSRIGKGFETVLFPEESILGPTTYIDMDYKSGPQMPKEKNEKSIKAFAAKRRDYTKKLQKDGKQTRFDIRMSRDEYLNTKTYLGGRNFTSGKYRITFKATALNRHLVKKAFEAGYAGLVKHKNKGYAKKYWSSKYQEDWKRLLHEEARLEFREIGMLSPEAHRRKLVTVSSSKRGKLIKSISIKDNVEKEYSFEFEFDMKNAIYIDWVNGPTIRVSPNAIGMVNLNGLKSVKGKSFFDRAGAEYNLPCIRILSEIKIERVSDIGAKSNYDISSVKNADESVIKKKLNDYIKELSLEHNSKQLNSIYDKLPKSMSAVEKYETTLKLLTMSPDHLFIDFMRDIPDAKSRYVSYSLLKTHPTEEFKEDYLLFRKGKLTSKQFAKKIVDNPGFERFIRIFAKGWLELGTVLDEKKFTRVKRELPFEKETEVYLNFLFKNNRPARELYDSDYKIVDVTLSNYYGVGNPDKLQRYQFSPVKLKDGKRGGITSQANFFVSQSSGVDPQPFVRAKWVSENIFDQKIPDPPNDIDTEEFVLSKELKTFKGRTDAHSKGTTCYSCHKVLDPIAFAMHNFDTMGARITKQDKNAEAQLKQRMAKADKTMATAFTRELLSFIVGRETTVYDSRVINYVVKKTASESYPLRDILSELIRIYFRK